MGAGTLAFAALESAGYEAQDMIENHQIQQEEQNQVSQPPATFFMKNSSLKRKGCVLFIFNHR